MSNLTHVTDASFKEEVLDNDLPVLVDFWAAWCGPCKLIGPIVEKIADANEGRLKIGKVDVDNNQQVAAQYGIRSIPTLILFKGGKPVEQIIGLVPMDQIQSKVDPYL
ncbi:thioredoxin [candidate division LCP-89 bacterium B3_LCP]|uniref:Thioredoxin n=1 Tax=candidate division LCP-89 bacterium B3_LCP TaxID=2012998 RepID=A0A532URJ8_UNCL8|nr:MAG: thioredoxin [candidate division LCP-89 bacterium B3_LCP]